MCRFYLIFAADFIIHFMKDEDIFELESNFEKPAVPRSKPKVEKKRPVAQMRKKQPVSGWGKSVWVRQIAYAAGGVIVLTLIAHLLLLQITRHGKTFLVPDFTGMSMEEARQVAKKKHLRLEVTDSVYVHHLPRGAVFKQNPQASVSVKKNRRVLLTINSLSPRLVLVPNVVGFSLRQANAVLNTQGLNVGTLQYVRDIATNNVLEQRYRGAPIAANVKLPAESAIDLILGINNEGIRTAIPQLTGLTLEQTKDLLIEYSLNTGRIQFDSNINNYADSLAAKVYRQIPAAAPRSELWNLGARVDIYLTLDPDKLPKE